MRKVYKGFYRLTKHELSKAWDEAEFCFDANVLLHLYQYSPALLKSFKSAVSSLGDRIFLPYQVGLEFHRNRHKAITDQTASFEAFRREYKSMSAALLKSIEGHHFLDSEEFKKKLEALEEDIAKTIKQKKSKYPNYLKDDKIREWVEQTFTGHIGSPPTFEILNVQANEAALRFAAELPPGFKDSNKDGLRKYGDYFIWCELLRKSDGKKPIIFITDDVKDDWWTVRDDLKKTKRLPHPTLIQEMWERNNVIYYSYTSEEFLAESRKRKPKSISEENLKEAALVRNSFSSFATLGSLSKTLEGLGQALVTYQNSENFKAMLNASLGGMTTYYNFSKEISPHIARLIMGQTGHDTSDSEDSSEE
jgi:hypothetical protein